MNRLKYIIFFSSLVLSLCMALIAVSLAVFLPRGLWEKQLIAALLLSLSPLPVITSVILLRAVSSYAGKAEQYSTRDPLTNLYNQRTFWDFLGYEIERSKRQNYRFTIMNIDIDNFKAINDLYGHEAGDAYLVEFSALFKAAIRKGDIAARYGGDNFTAILPVCDEAQAYIVAKRLLESLRENAYVLPNRTSVQITASIGIAVFPDHAQDAQSLYLLADSMLSQAKTSGKDGVSIPSDEVDIHMLKSAGEKSLLIMEAIREKQIVPYFQPIVSVKDQAVLAYEVLTRIVTPEKVIPAADFIEAAEGMGAIVKISYLLIEHALDTVKRYGYQGKLFFNLSPKALLLREFMPRVRNMLEDHEIEPAQVVFEITERDTVKNPGLIETNVRNLKRDGFRFAIDDFGAGYSSFQYIKMFKVDYLKVDGEFIRNMTGSGCMENAVVSNIASLAEDLGIETIAEHVESETILGNVQSAGIDYAQGYFIQRPAPELTLYPVFQKI